MPIKALIVALGAVAAASLPAGQGVGAAIRQINGYDLSTLGVIAVVAIAVLAIYFGTTAIMGSQHMQSMQPALAGGACKPANAAAEPMSAYDIVSDLRQDLFKKYSFTRRECDVAGFVLDGLTASSAADSLGISEATVRYHLRNVYAKAGVLSKSEFMQRVARDLEESKPDISLSSEN